MEASIFQLVLIVLYGFFINFEKTQQCLELINR